jgi:hypothetical protein
MSNRGSIDAYLCIGNNKRGALAGRGDFPFHAATAWASAHSARYTRVLAS